MWAPSTGRLLTVTLCLSLPAYSFGGTVRVQPPPHKCKPPAIYGATNPCPKTQYCNLKGVCASLVLANKPCTTPKTTGDMSPCIKGYYCNSVQKKCLPQIQVGGHCKSHLPNHSCVEGSFCRPLNATKGPYTLGKCTSYGSDYTCDIASGPADQCPPGVTVNGPASPPGHLACDIFNNIQYNPETGEYTVTASGPQCLAFGS